MMYSMLVKLANPFLLLMLALGVTLIAKWRRREGRSRWLGLVTATYLLLYVYCLPATAYLLSGSLEWQLARVIDRPAEIQAIVVLGGGIVPPPREGILTRLADNSLWRCHRAEELYHAGPSCLLFVMGGNPDGQRGEDVSTVMAGVLEQLGVAKGDLVVEMESRNTNENAKAAAGLLKADNVSRALLVTSALHLPRATRLFREHGVEVIPAGCDYRTDEFEWGLFAFLPSARAAATTTEASREWLSTLAQMLP
jgi:uncharacterized SAM-binding protein YcdF (DUF218 family)